VIPYATQTLIDSLLAEQQRGAEETELDMIIEQANEKFSDPLAVLGYQRNPVCQAPRGGCQTFFSPGPDRP
jgi:lipoate-protein ligase B